MNLREWQEIFWQALPKSIHGNNSHAQRISALQKTFPASLAMMGASRFYFLANQFVEQHPSVSVDIAASGADFVEFVPEIFVHDLLRYEWAWHQTFHGVNHGDVDRAAFASAHEESIVSLTEDTQLLKTSGDAFLLWQCHQPEYAGPSVELQLSEHYYALQQRHDLVVTQSLSLPEYRGLCLLLEPKKLGRWLLECSAIENFKEEFIANYAERGLITIEER